MRALFALLISILVAVPVYAADPEPLDYGPEISLEQAIKIGEAFIKRDLLDPYSVVFEWPFTFVKFTEKVPFFKRTTGYATCLSYNAKNAMGGYTGVAQYRIIIRDSQVIDVMKVSNLRLVPSICKELIDKFGMTVAVSAPPP